MRTLYTRLLLSLIIGLFSFSVLAQTGNQKNGPTPSNNQPKQQTPQKEPEKKLTPDEKMDKVGTACTKINDATGETMHGYYRRVENMSTGEDDIECCTWYNPNLNNF